MGTLFSPIFLLLLVVLAVTFTVILAVTFAVALAFILADILAAFLVVIHRAPLTIRMIHRLRDSVRFVRKNRSLPFELFNLL